MATIFEMEPVEARELELRDYISVLRRRKVVIGLTTVAIVVAALLFSLLQSTVYRANAEVLLQTRASEQIFQPNQQQNAANDTTRVATEIQVMESRSVQDAVTQAMGRKVTVDIAAQGQTDVVSISAEDHDPKQAARIAETYAETYVKVRRDQTINDLLDASTQIQSQIDSINAQISTLNTKVTDLNAQIAAAATAADRQQLSSQRDALQAENASKISALQTRISSYTAQLDNLQVASNLTTTGGAQIVSQAQVPTSPVKPTPKRDGVVALFVGLILGIGVAFLREYLDDSIKSKDDLEAATGLPILSIVPAVETWRDRAATTVITESAPKSPAAEAYRTLRTSVQFVGLEKPVQVVQITSPVAAEGKTTTLANLGVVLARAGKRVVLVDWDLRRPRIESFFGVDNFVGFTNVVVGDAHLSDAVCRAPNEPRLAVLPSGPPPPNPSELLTTKRAAEIVNTLREEADFILIDCPPVLPVADSIIIAGVVDATILVVTAGSTTKRQTGRAIELLAQVDAPLIGTVLNGASGESGYGYGGGYSYGYAYAYGSSRSGQRRGLFRRGRGDRPQASEQDAAPERALR